MSKILIVGAGLSGSVVARQLADKNYKVDIIEKKNHLGGDMFDYVNKYGIRVHKYGPHLFHTNDKRIVKWLQRFATLIEYKHKVKAQLFDGTFVTMPPNIETQMIIGKNKIEEILYKPYTEKMWGIKYDEIDTSTYRRVKIRYDNNELYSPNDKYQYVTKDGYTQMFKNILNHKNITIKLNTKFNKKMEDKYDYVFNGMSIDEYYNYKYGKLTYRSLKFKNFNLPFPKLLPTTTVNFTNNSKYTRITEWKNIPNHGFNENITTLTAEEPCDFKENVNERLYLIRDKNNTNLKLYEKYKNIKNKKTIFIGRCGTCTYLNMNETIKASLEKSKKFLILNTK